MRWKLLYLQIAIIIKIRTTNFILLSRKKFALKVFLNVEIVVEVRTVSLFYSYLGNIFVDVSRKTTLWNGSGKKSLCLQKFLLGCNICTLPTYLPCFSSDVPDSSEAPPVLIVSIRVVFSILVEVLFWFADRLLLNPVFFLLYRKAS